MSTEAMDKSQLLKQALTEIRSLKRRLEEREPPREARIAVVGMACRFPGGIAGPDSYWQALEEMQDMIGGVPPGRWSGVCAKENSPYLHKAGFLLEDIEAFDHRLFRLAPQEAERIDPQQRLFLKVCWEALENAGYAPDSLRGSDTGVYAGVSAMDYAHLLHAERQAGAVCDPADVTGSGFSFLTGRAAYCFGFQGPALTVDTACSASLVAVDQACKGLLAGDCGMALAGGVNLLYSPETTELLAALNILSPDCTLRSFDAKANGTVRGEGCGVVVLKKLSAAERDGDRIYAVIRGSGVNQDGLSSGLTAPYGPAQERLIASVWKRCGLDASDIGYIEAHGTGTELGDPIELSALGNAAAGRDTPLYVGTVKSGIGHLEAAAGIAGLIKIVLAVERGRIPGNLHFEQPTPHVEWERLALRVPVRTLPWESAGGKPRIAAVSSFGLSGTNAHAVVEEYRGAAGRGTESAAEAGGTDTPLPFKFSSVTGEGLRAQLRAFAAFLNSKTSPASRWSDLSYSQNVAKADLPQRLVLWASSPAQLREVIGQSLDGESGGGIIRGTKAKKVVFLFTGQGSQYPSMLADLYQGNPVFRARIDECCGYYRKLTGSKLTELLFSPDGRINDTHYTQPALFAVEYALAAMWLDYGLQPDLMLGHSVGEYAAACIAGIFSLEDAVKLITARGEGMAGLAEKGSMAAVFADRERVERRLAGYPHVSIAASNTPEQTVISGREREVAEITALLEQEGVRCVALNVSHAFHSPLMRPMLETFAAIANEVRYYSPSRPLLSSVTAQKAGQAMSSPDYWSGQIAAEVRFMDSIRALGNAEKYVFLEIGPSPVLTSMVRGIAGTAADAVASAAQGADTAEQVRRSLFHLYSRGAAVNWRKYYAHPGALKVTVPNYAFQEQVLRLNKRSSPGSATAPAVQAGDARTDAGAPTGAGGGSAVNACADSPSASAADAQAGVGIAPGMYATEAAAASAGMADDALGGVAAPEAGSYPWLMSSIVFGNPDGIKAYVRHTLSRELKLAGNEPADDENLLLYGLNSILGARLAAVWQSELGISLNPGILLSHCTIGQWAELLADALRSFVPEPQPEPPQQPVLTTRIVTELSNPAACFRSSPETRHEPFPLNDIQQAYLAGRNPELEWGGVSCGTYFEIDWNGLDAQRFEQALHALVERHEMLRAVILADGTQRILPEYAPSLPLYDRSGIVHLPEHLKKIREEMAVRLLPPGQPLFELRLTELAEGEWRIHFAVDFIIADALSLFIFWKDLYRFYMGESLPSLGVSFRDYVLYQSDRKRDARYEADRQYWLERMAGFPGAPELPVSLSAQEGNGRAFVRRKHVLEPAVWRRFAETAAASGLTPSAALLGLYAEVLSAWGGGSHFAIMLTVFERQAVHPQIDGIIGDFTRLMLLEVRRRQQTAALNAADIQRRIHADLPHGAFSAIDFVKELNKREEGGARLYPVVFTSALGVEELGERTAEDGFLGQMGWSLSYTPQVWLDHQIYKEGDGVALSWDVREAVFPSGVVQDMFDKYVELVLRAAAGESFWAETLDDLRPAVHRETQERSNATAKPMRDRLLHEETRLRAALHPERTAVICGGRHYSYKELIGAADRVSDLLRTAGCVKGDRIALQLDKSFIQTAVVLGIVQAGMAYVPLPGDQPHARTLAILRQAEAAALFVERPLDLPEAEIRQLTLSELETHAAADFRDSGIVPSDPAYVIFTSGSTGAPKGVVIQHQAAMNTIMEVNRRLAVGEGDRLLGLSMLSFDLSVYDMFGMWSAGGALVLPDESERLDPKSWRRLAQEHRVTVWNSVPALMGMYADYLLGQNPPALDQGIRRVVLSGDWIPLPLPHKLGRALPSAELTAMGGATEASIWSNYYEVKEMNPAWASIPYGYPLANQFFRVLDEFGRPCPVGVKGKLYIGGKGLSLGYLGDEELTGQAFAVHPRERRRLYDTGDYGRYFPDGSLEFLGRADQQLKINGYRIETGELQAAFRRSGMAEATVIMPVDMPGGRKLAAWVKGDPAAVAAAEVKRRLRAWLPAYALPDIITVLEELPLTPNGKLDRARLLAALDPDLSGPPSASAASQSGNGGMDGHPVLRTIRELLRMPRLQADHQFEALGVSSLEIINLANGLESRYGDRPSVGDMIRCHTVADLLAFYPQDVRERTEGDEAPARPPGCSRPAAECSGAEPKSEPQSRPKSERESEAQPEAKTEPESKPPAGRYDDIAGLIEQCRARGISLWAEGEKLRFRAPAGAMTAGLQARLKAVKNRLAAYLRDLAAGGGMAEEAAGRSFAASGGDAAAGTAAETAAVPEQSGARFPLTPIQLAYALGRSTDYALGNTGAHYYSEYECRFIDAVKLETAVNSVIAGHDMLRAVIHDDGTQQVLEEVPRFRIPVREIRDEQELEDIRRQWSHHRYELGRWPMFHISVSQMGHERFRLHFSFDCLILDGWSAEMMFRDIFRVYGGRTVLKPAFSFRDYVLGEREWLKDKSYHQKAAAYWRDKARSLPPAPQLPLRAAPEEIAEPHFARRKLALSAEATSLLEERARAFGFTPAAVICTVYMKVLSNWSCNKEITLNLTLYNRLPLHRDVPLLLGDFTNIALIAFRPDFAGSFSAEAKAVQEQLWAAIEHRTYNGIELLRQLARDTPGKAVMPFVFTSLLFGESADTVEQELPADMNEVYAVSQTPQVLMDHQAIKRGGALTLNWDVVEEAFSDGVVDEMFAAFSALIGQLVAERDWDRIAALPDGSHRNGAAGR